MGTSVNLTDLNPAWIGHGGEGISRNGKPVPYRGKVGIMFDCPCGCDARRVVPFSNPVDPGPLEQDGWKRTGDTFETMTLSPSIHIVKPRGCGWHGWLRDGKMVT